MKSLFSGVTRFNSGGWLLVNGMWKGALWNLWIVLYVWLAYGLIYLFWRLGTPLFALGRAVQIHIGRAGVLLDCTAMCCLQGVRVLVVGLRAGTLAQGLRTAPDYAPGDLSRWVTFRGW